MSKEAYLDMCEMMGSEPLESEMPVEYEDLIVDVQEAMQIYFKLKDEWDSMSGTYYGKNYSGIKDIFDILDVPVEDRKTVYDLIGIIDKHRTKAVNDKIKSDKAPKP